MGIVDPEGDVHGVPDLVIEVLSPSTSAYDRTLKRKHYLEAGLGELWLIDIDSRAVETWRAGSDRPEREDGVVTWHVADHSFALDCERIFRALQ